jgi:hypothetical protein
VWTGNRSGDAVIILLESGVERPGGLQGNIEYVEFERESPQTKFDKILEMITALSPKAPKGQTQAIDPRLSPSEQPAEANVSSADDFWKPKAGWTQAQYDFALRRAIFLDDEDAAKLVNEDYARSVLFTDEKVMERVKDQEVQFYALSASAK